MSVATEMGTLAHASHSTGEIPDFANIRPAPRISRRIQSRKFSLLQSTAEHHKALERDKDKFYGPYAHIRKNMDYSFHTNYTKERQWMQDSIIEEMMEPIRSAQVSTTPVNPWLIYTVGAPGAGKHYTLLKLVKDGLLPLMSYVSVDQHEIRRKLPEFASYCSRVPDQADALTAKESAYILELLMLAAIQTGHNVVVDGSIQDAAWHKTFFDTLKRDYAALKIALLHVTAPFEVILGRAAEVSLLTGRIIPDEKIQRILGRIPESLDVLRDEVDYTCTIRNDAHHDLELLETPTPTTSGPSWENFRENFTQVALRPEGENFTEEELQKATDMAVKNAHSICSRKSPKARRGFTATKSSEDNHKADKPEFYGAYSHIRSTLDYSYHEHYTFSRQVLQDQIITDMLDHAVIKDVNGNVCTTPTEPWIVFTAGAMGAGKSYTMNKLVQKGRFPLLAFVIVDPDEIRRHLPEFHLYVDESPELAGELTRKEAGFISEILTLAALQAGKNVLVDGSLRDSKWYGEYFSRLRTEFPILRQAILHVTAPREAVFQRAADRALTTGRVVPRATLEMALDQVPKSVHILKEFVDYFCELNNAPKAPDIEIMGDQDWPTFEKQWIQTCAWVPSKRKFLRSTKAPSGEKLLSVGAINA